jgi:acetylglutamate kinase
MKENLYLIKIGGNVVDRESIQQTFLHDFAALPGHKMLVHGGGKLADALAHQLGIPQQMVDGRRITDADTLRVVTMVYAGWINKSLVAALNARGMLTLGLSGTDAQLIPAVKRPVGAIDYGFVGNVLEEAVNTDFLVRILEQHIVPVIAPISADASGQLLNINADTIARTLAIALAGQYRVQLVYCFDQPGVLTDVSRPETRIARLDRAQYGQLRAGGSIHSGMIPKLDNAFGAMDRGVDRVLLGRAEELATLIVGAAGTTLC